MDCSHRQRLWNVDHRYCSQEDSYSRCRKWWESCSSFQLNSCHWPVIWMAKCFAIVIGDWFSTKHPEWQRPWTMTTIARLQTSGSWLSLNPRHTVLIVIPPRPQRRANCWQPSRTVGATVTSTNAFTFRKSLVSTSFLKNGAVKRLDYYDKAY